MDDSKKHLLVRRKRHQSIQQPVSFVKCKEKNLSVYLHLLDVRERFQKSKKYQAWNYYADKDVVEEQSMKRTSVDLESVDVPPGHITSVSFSKPERQGSERKSAKKVAFSVAENKNESEAAAAKFPYIEPSSRASSQTRVMTKLSDVTFGSKNTSGRKSATSNQSSLSRDDELFQITFRGSSRASQRRYDPRSELHSDYYSIKKVSKSPQSQQSQQERPVSYPESRTFQAVLMGSQKRMIKKYDERNLKIPSYTWSKMNRVSNIRGFTSVPIY